MKPTLGMDWGNSVWNWMRSTDGLAAAQWGSALLSLGAILVAIVVFLSEQSRANDEKLREQRREREVTENIERGRLERRAYLRGEVVRLINRGLAILETDLPSNGAMFMLWASHEGKPLKLKALDLALETLALATTESPELLLALSEARSILQATIDSGIGVSPSVGAVLNVLSRSATALRKVRARIPA